MRKIYLLPLLFLFLDGCVDPLGVAVPANNAKMIVYGMITQLPGPYEVQLSYSSELDRKTKNIIRATGASVWIIGDDETEEKLSEISAGVYQTIVGGIQGIPGRSYHVRIITKDGHEYESVPQILHEPSTIENVYTEFEQGGVVLNDQGTTGDAFNVFIDAKGNDQGRLLRWRWKGVYVGRTYPELHDTLYPKAKAPSPYPLPCSGYILVLGKLKQVGECTCCVCWSYNYSAAAIVSKNAYASDNTFRKVNLGKVAVTPMHFYERYYIEVEQFSLSEDSYSFWKLMEAQQQAIGSIFQPNSVRIKGNIKSLTAPDEIVLGIFEASSVKRKSIFLGKEQIPYTLPPISPLGEDCRWLFNNPSTTMPVFW